MRRPVMGVVLVAAMVALVTSAAVAFGARDGASSWQSPGQGQGFSMMGGQVQGFSMMGGQVQGSSMMGGQVQGSSMIGGRAARSARSTPTPDTSPLTSKPTARSVG